VLLSYPFPRASEHFGTAYVLYRPSEAYVLGIISRAGWTASTFKLVLYSLAAFGGPVNNLDLRLHVFRITPTSLEHHVVRFPDGPREFFGYGDYIGTWESRWVGDHFERTDTMKWPGLMPSDNFTDVNGWSKRQVPLPDDRSSHESTITFVLGGRVVSLHGRFRDYRRELWLDRHDGLSSQRLMQVDERPRYVSSAEYGAMFDR